MHVSNETLLRQCGDISLILSDVDGVMTDGGVRLWGESEEMVSFNIRDGLGIRLWREEGLAFGIITGRDVSAVRRRAKSLDFDEAEYAIVDKWQVASEIIDRRELSPEQVCYLGDDLPDIPVLRQVGLGVAPADAASDVLAVADAVTKTRGGAGVVREVIEFLLTQQGKWQQIVQRF